MTMNAKKSRSGRLNKGAPSGFIVSLIFHAAVFFIAGIFVVFAVVRKPEPEFEPPPPIERPKMKLKKPKVKVRKSSQPKPSSRIVAKVKTREMPEIQLPDLTGTGDGLLGGLGDGGEFMDLPDIGEMSLFGGGITSGSDLEVTFYSMRRRANGTDNENMDHQMYTRIIKEFVENGWDTSRLRKYYHSPRKLYASTIFIPPVTSIAGPLSFGEEIDMQLGSCWAAHYHGELIHKDGITFRFWGHADDVLTVALNKEVVLAANLPWTGIDAWMIADGWNGYKAPGSRGQTSGDGQHPCGNGNLAGSDWITLEPGVPYEFDAVVGEAPGGQFCAVLLVEVQGEEYELNEYGGRTFSLFATQPLSRQLQDTILMGMYEGDAMVTNVTTYFSGL